MYLIEYVRSHMNVNQVGLYPMLKVSIVTLLHNNIKDPKLLWDYAKLRDGLKVMSTE